MTAVSDNGAPTPFTGTLPNSCSTSKHDHDNGARVIKAGLLQTIHLGPTWARIEDDMYGSHMVTEPSLVALLSSAAVLRLGTVHQHGMTGLFRLTAPVTRLEHSVGAMLLVRSVGAGVEEQAAALLHDISHTALSHVVDCASLCEGSYHEVHKDAYVATTELPALIALHGLPASVLDEEDYPLVEQPSPSLCADRLDYGLRDAVAFKYLSLDKAQKVFANLTAHPSASAPNRILALRDPQLALAIARAYLESDRGVWCNPAHSDMYYRAGLLINILITSGRISERELWSSDEVFWQRMRQVAHGDEIAKMDALEYIPDMDGDTLPWPKEEIKVRTLDPHLIQPDGSRARLTDTSPEWAQEREAYIAERYAMCVVPASTQ